MRLVQVLRVLPKKRLVAYVRYRNQPAVIKLFFDKLKAKKHSSLELNGLWSLQKAQISIPRILQYGEQQGVYFVLSEFIETPKPVEEIWHHPNDADFTILMKRLLTLMILQYRHGLVQHDLHPGNFLWNGKTLFCIDGGSISKFNLKSQNQRRMAFFNVVKLFAQLSPRRHAMYRSLLKFYYNEAKVPFEPTKLTSFFRALYHERLKRERRKLQKIQRSSTHVVACRNFFRTTFYNKSHQSAEFLELLKHPERVMKRGEVLNQSDEVTLVRMAIQNQVIMIKQYQLKKRTQQVKRWFGISQATRAWKNAHRLELVGLSTPKPLAMIECRFGPFKTTSYYISAYVEGDVLNSKALSLPQQKKGIRKTVDAIRALSEVRLVYRNLKASNFIMQNETLYMINLERLIRPRTRFKRYLQKDLSRFLKNWRQNLELFKFTKQYLKEVFRWTLVSFL